MGISLATVKSFGAQLTARLARVVPVRAEVKDRVAPPKIQEMPTAQSAGVARFAEREVVSAALQERLLASATMGKEGFQLLPDLKSPLKPEEAQVLINLLVRLKGSSSGATYLDDVLAELTNPVSTITVSEIEILRRLNLYIRELERSGQRLIPGENWKIGNREIRWGPVWDREIEDFHADGLYVRLVVVLSGSGTLIRVGDSEVAVPSLIPFLFTGKDRSVVVGIPATLHRAPRIGEGEQRLILVLSTME